MSKKSDKKFMRMAVRMAAQGVKKGQAPFGACLVWKGKMISCVHNQVWKDEDITAHAEILALRLACRKLKTIHLSGSVIYTTCEPCPMCFAACHWAGISRIAYGLQIEDAQKLGFNELKVPSKEMKRRGKSPVVVSGGILRKENLKVFTDWLERKEKRIY